MGPTVFSTCMRETKVVCFLSTVSQQATKQLGKLETICDSCRKWSKLVISISRPAALSREGCGWPDPQGWSETKGPPESCLYSKLPAIIK